MKTTSAASSPRTANAAPATLRSVPHAAKTSMTRTSTVTVTAIRTYFASSQEVCVPELHYQREESVEPARIASFAALRQRFKRGKQLMTEESRMLDLYELTSRRSRPTQLSPRSAAPSSPSAGGPDDQE